MWIQNAVTLGSLDTLGTALKRNLQLFFVSSTKEEENQLVILPRGSRDDNTHDDAAVSVTKCRSYQRKFRKPSSGPMTVATLKTGMSLSCQNALYVNNMHFNCFQREKCYFMVYCTTSCQDPVTQFKFILCITCVQNMYAMLCYVKLG